MFSAHLSHPFCILEVQRECLSQLHILSVHTPGLLVQVLDCHVMGLLGQASHLSIGLFLESVLQGGERRGGVGRGGEKRQRGEQRKDEGIRKNGVVRMIKLGKGTQKWLQGT